jgi:hypothetical protein
MPDRPDPLGRLRRQAVLVGCVLATLAFAVQFAFNLLWPDAAFGALLAVLYLLVKALGDRLVAGLAPEAPRMRPDQEWTHWLSFALPAALLQAGLLAMGAFAARTAAAAFPCALFVADIGWLRAVAAPGPEADSLGRRLAAWP